VAFQVSLFSHQPLHLKYVHEQGLTYDIHGNSITLVKLARTLSLIIAVIRESKRLGATVTTLIPYRARSRVRGRVSDAMAPLDAEYATASHLVSK